MHKARQHFSATNARVFFLFLCYCAHIPWGLRFAFEEILILALEIRGPSSAPLHCNSNLLILRHLLHALRRIFLCLQLRPEGSELFLKGVNELCFTIQYLIESACVGIDVVVHDLCHKSEIHT